MNNINIYFNKSEIEEFYSYNGKPFFEYFKQVNEIESINTKNRVT